MAADWPAKSAIVTGPERCFHDTSPSNILPSIFRLNTAMSPVFSSAFHKLADPVLHANQHPVGVRRR